MKTMYDLIFSLEKAKFAHANLTCPYLLNTISISGSLNEAIFDGNSNVYSRITAANFISAKIVACGVPGQSFSGPNLYNKTLVSNKSDNIDWVGAKLLRGKFEGGKLIEIEMDGKIVTSPEIPEYSTTLLKNAIIAETAITNALLLKVKVKNIWNGTNFYNCKIENESLILN